MRPAGRALRPCLGPCLAIGSVPSRFAFDPLTWPNRATIYEHKTNLCQGRRQMPEFTIASAIPCLDDGSLLLQRLPSAPIAPLDMGLIAHFPHRRWTSTTAGPMRKLCFAVRADSPPVRLVATTPRRLAWGASFTFSVSAAFCSAAPRESEASVSPMRKVVPSIRAGVSLPPQGGVIRPAGRHASAGHGVLRSFLRVAPRPAAAPSPELT